MPGILDVENRNLKVYFDGICNLCTGFVRFVSERADGGISFETLQESDGEDFDTILAEDSSGRTYRKSRAVAEILKRLGFPYPWLGVLLSVVPGPVADPVYDLVAHLRRSVFGTREKCVNPRELD